MVAMVVWLGNGGGGGGWEMGSGFGYVGVRGFMWRKFA